MGEGFPRFAIAAVIFAYGPPRTLGEEWSPFAPEICISAIDSIMLAGHSRIALPHLVMVRS